MFGSHFTSILSGRHARSILRPLGLALFIVLQPIALPLHAAVLRLGNGDRITGELVRQAHGKIYFHSPLLGDLVVPEQDAVVEPGPAVPSESLAGLPPASGQGPLNQSTPAPGAMPATLAAPAVTPAPWQRKIEFGFQSQTTSPSSINGSLRASAERKKGANDLLASARYIYGEADHVVTSNRQNASFRWRHELTPEIFAQSQTSYTRDRVTGIQINLEQNGSLGYRMVINPRQKATAGAGVTVQYRATEGYETGVNYLGQIFQDYSYKINDRLSFSQSFNALYSPEPAVRLLGPKGKLPGPLDDSSTNYSYSFDSTLQGKMTETVSLNLRYEYDYDNAILNREERGTQRVTSSIGYSF